MGRATVRMLVLTTVSLALLAPGAGGQGLPIRMSGCLHGQDETAGQRLRRQDALALLKAINTAEGQLVQRSKAYGALQQLGPLPPAPDGFVIRLYAGQDGYLVSVKDDRDPCRFALFSDQGSHVYESKLPAPQIAS
ncbi:MAG TPA: hypothetical protein VFV95_01435 [Vicinamibacterales bacterium]|nr:hypothetical protein [Vicinamibacterales bacterium]